jgi:hypothetical protein
MKNILISTAAFLALSTGLTFAGVGPSFHSIPNVEMQQDGNILLVRRGRGGDDSGSDDNGGDRDGNDDGQDSDSSSSTNDSNNDVSGSGRKKPRVKGGSGCDDAGDVAEHAACR